MYKILFALASALNLLTGIGLSVGAVRILVASAGGMAGSAGRQEFAVGMLAGGLSVVMGILASIQIGVAWLCWRYYNRFEQPLRAKAFVLGLGLVPVGLLILFVAARLAN